MYLVGTSGLVANSNRWTTRTGDQALRFDSNVAGTNLPSEITLNATTGEITFPEGLWMLCLSGRVTLSSTQDGQNNRSYVSIAIREGATDYRHVSTPFYGRWTQNGTGAGTFPTISTAGGNWTTPERNAPFSVSGVVVAIRWNNSKHC